MAVAKQQRGQHLALLGAQLHGLGQAIDRRRHAGVGREQPVDRRRVRAIAGHMRQLCNFQIAGVGGHRGAATIGNQRRFGQRFQPQVTLGRLRRRLRRLGLELYQGRWIPRAEALSAEFEGTELADVRERFFREAETAGRLQHPNIVTVFDYGRIEGLADWSGGSVEVPMGAAGINIQVGNIACISCSTLRAPSGALGKAYSVSPGKPVLSTVPVIVKPLSTCICLRNSSAALT